MEQRQALALAFDKAVFAALSDLIPRENLHSVKDGRATLRQCESSFKRIDDGVNAWLTANSMSLQEFYSAIGQYVVKKCSCRSITQARRYLFAIMKNPDNQKRVLGYVMECRKELKENENTIRSILLSIKKLCDMTFTKNRVSRPSIILDEIVKNGSLGRYLGWSLSYHFMSLIPNIDKEIQEYGTTRSSISNVNNKVLDDEYAMFCDDLAKYKYEAMKACRCLTGCPIIREGLLPFMDRYYCETYLPEHSGQTSVK